MKPQVYPLWVVVSVDGLRYAAPVAGWEDGYAMVPLGRANLSTLAPDVECTFDTGRPSDANTLTQSKLDDKMRRERR